MLASATDVLREARAGGYAVPGFDCVEDVMVRAILETAEACAAPVFLMCLVPDLDSGCGAGWTYLPGLIRAAAGHHAIPVVLHLDHATDLESVRKAVDCGFTSVMIDGSRLPFEENVALTRAAVEIARPRGVSVEGELGHVGGLDLEATARRENVLTERDEVARFVEQTGVDSLAVSIGTAHGVYASLPTLNIERLDELNQASPVPLVLHGGSGTPEDQIREAVRHGISKLNIYADCRVAMGRGLQEAAQSQRREDPLPGEVFGPIKAAIARVVRAKIELLGAGGRAGPEAARGPVPAGGPVGAEEGGGGTMKLLAISDAYIPAAFMRQGLESLEALGVTVEVRPWEHASLIQLQEANLAIERSGPDAVPLSDAVTQDLDAFQIVVVQFAPISGRFIQAATDLRVIGVLRGGTENVDVRWATERGIAVLNTPGRNARAVAECTLGLILAEVRNLARAHACLVHGQWRRDFANSGAIPELNERTVGLVGYGAVGRLVAGYLDALGSRILAYDPYVRDDPAPAQLVDLPTLLRQSDVVSLHARLTDETRHLIGARELGWMKPTAVLVNTARSGLVDEQALIQALAERRIMGAALDVFDIEPLPSDHPLLQLDNVTLTPHLAGSTMDAFRNSPKMMAAHLARMLRGEGPLPVVNGIAPAGRLGRGKPHAKPCPTKEASSP